MQTAEQPAEPSATSSPDRWRLDQVPPSAVLHVWPSVSGLVQSVVARGEGSYLEADIAMACMSGAWLLWIVRAFATNVPVAIGITELVAFPRQQKLLIRYVAGDMAAIEKYIPVLEAWGRAKECSVIEAYARRGWAKVLDGYSERYVIIQKEL